MQSTDVHLSTQHEETSYLGGEHSIKSWLLTKDHKRIAILYLFSVSLFFLIGSIAAMLVRLELTSPTGMLGLTSDGYNKAFTAHGVVMIFLFLIVAIPAVFGNFLLPIMLGARDLAFPRLNLASWYMFMIGGIMILWATLGKGVDTGWTFYTPMSSLYSNTEVTLALVGAFIVGFSSIFTGVNFIVTIHKMRAPGMTWWRLPLFVWSHYATSIVVLLGTPVVAITLLMVVVGGVKSLAGPIVGAIVYFLFKDLLGEHATHSMAIFGAALIAVIVFSPDGLIGALQRVAKRKKVHP